MKRCPTCESTFEDNMRFCQKDGTQLVSVEEPVDPYKTMVARPEDIASAIPPKPAPLAPEPEVLEVPKADPNKTVFVSEAELRREMEASKTEEPVIDIPPATTSPAPPAFIDADLNPVNVPPPTPTPAPVEPPVGNLTTPPIPSPFPKPSSPDIAQPKPTTPPPVKLPDFDDEPKPVAVTVVEPKPAPPPASPLSTAQPPAAAPLPASGSFGIPQAKGGRTGAPSASTPSDQQLAKEEWTPPAAPKASAQPAGGKPPAAAKPAGQSSLLAIISLVVGILSLCCSSMFIPGLAAVILGFVAKGKAKKDPVHFGGAGLAWGGIILGLLSMFLGILVWIWVLLFGGMSILMQLANAH